MKYSNEWEKIDEFTHRMKVPGGWIVTNWIASAQNEAAHAMCYVPDPKSEWTI